MIKKVIFFIGIFIIFAIVAYIAINFISFKINEPPENWKKIDLKEYGHIFVPEDWNFSVDDGFMYIYSEENGERKNILVQHVKYYNDDAINKYFSEIEDIVVIYSATLSSSATIEGVEVLYKDGSSIETFRLEFGDAFDITRFICMDDSVSEKTLEKIAYYYNTDDTFSLRRGD